MACPGLLNRILSVFQITDQYFMIKYLIPGILLFLYPSVAAQVINKQKSLLADTIKLKEITVTSTVPLNDRQIEKFYKTNYFSTIDNLTSHLDGISLIKRGSYAMEPQMNGFSGGQLNITIDGMKMFGACTDKMDPVTSYIEPVNLKSITLEHGTNGGLYGNNIGGSMDMALQEPEMGRTHPFYSSASYGYESISNSRNALLSMGYISGKWQWVINGVYRKNDNYRDGKGREIKFSQFKKSNIHTSFKYMVDSISSFKADLLYDLATGVGYPALPMDVSRARAVISGVEYRRLKPGKELLAKVYYNSVLHIMDDSHRDSLFFVNNNSTGKQDSVIMRMDMPGRSNTSGAFIQYKLKINDRNRLLIKADNYINNSLAEMTMHMHFTGKPPDPPMYLQTWPEMKRNVTGLYARNITDISERVSLSINGRLDYNADILQSDLAKEQFSVFNYQLERKSFRFTKGLNAVLQVRVAKPLLVTFQTGLSERIPTINELYGFYLFNAYDGYDYIGNPYLKTEKSMSGQLSLTWFRNGLKINLSQSYNQLRDYIMGITNTEIPPMNFYSKGLRIYNNLAGARIAGTDLQVMYNGGHGLTLFMLSKFTWGGLNTGEPLPLIPPLKNLISICYEWRNWTFQAENESALRQNRINLLYGESKTPSYTVFNIKTNRHFMLPGIMLDTSLGITNLFSANYSEHLDWGHIPRPGRSINFFIKLSY
jgi:iron complex outermembrane recepter protein